MDANDLNKRMKDFMPDLSVKVFRWAWAACSAQVSGSKHTAQGTLGKAALHGLGNCTSCSWEDCSFVVLMSVSLD